MFKVSNRFYSFIALLFVFLSLLGYQLATTALLPIASDSAAVSQTVTYPYRAVVFVLAFFLIVATPFEKKISSSRRATIIYIVLMLVYFIRILVDIFVRQVYIQPGFQRVVLQYMFIAMIPSIWATARCAKYIDFNRLNQWLMIGGVLLLGVTVWNQNSLIAAEYEEMARGEGNVALNSIGFGHTCVSVFIVFFSWIACNKEGKRIWKAVLILLMVMSFVLMLRAASRGPLVSFVIVLLFFLFSRMKNKVVGLIISLVVILLVWVNMSTILEWLGSISPMMEQRMAATMYEDDSSGRDSLYKQAIDIFLQNPVLGKQFVLNNGFYSHNSVLDLMIGLGFFGALVWLYLIWKDVILTYRHILNKTAMMAICLLSVQFILKGFLSGAIYTDNALAICMLIVLSAPKPSSQG